MLVPGIHVDAYPVEVVNVVAHHRAVVRAVLDVDALAAVGPGAAVMHMVAQHRKIGCPGDGNVFLVAVVASQDHLVLVYLDVLAVPDANARRDGIVGSVTLDQEIGGGFGKEPRAGGVDHAQAAHHQVVPFTQVDQAAPAAGDGDPTPVQGGSLARVGGVGDRVAGQARILRDQALVVSSAADQHGIARLQGRGGVLQGAPGQVFGARVEVIASGSKVKGKPVGFVRSSGWLGSSRNWSAGLRGRGRGNPAGQARQQPERQGYPSNSITPGAHCTTSFIHE